MKNNTPLKIWFIPHDASLKVITKEEEIFSKSLNPFRRKKYIHSRGYIREVLSKLFLIEPLDIPLINPIGKPPILSGSLGYLSLSYSNNNLVICWSFNKVGIDIESSFRKFDANKLMNRYYFEDEIDFLKNFDIKKMRELVLQYWVLKEASIKLIGGTISNNLNKIQIMNNNFAKNNSNGLSINLINLNYKDFTIGIASLNKIINKEFIICEY